MKLGHADFWVKAGLARDKLASRLIEHPQVSMIDIGYDTADRAQEKKPVLRLHIRGDIGDLQVPAQIDGIPVIVIEGDYQPE